MTGRPGHRTVEMNGGSSAPYLACTLCVPLFCTLFNRGETEGLLDYQGRTGIISIVQWNRRPVIFGVGIACRVPELNPLSFCESRFGGLETAIRANHSHVMKIGILLRIDSRESIHANRPDSHCESLGHLSSRLKSLCWALFYVKAQGIPNINF